jgi:hypothetical protein
MAYLLKLFGEAAALKPHTKLKGDERILMFGVHWLGYCDDGS